MKQDIRLEQELPADAAVDVFFMADLNRVLTRFGNRGYRAAQLEAGMLGGRMYLSSYAQNSEQAVSLFTMTTSPAFFLRMHEERARYFWWRLVQH